MRNGTYYLNNSGSRWVHYDNGKKERIKVLMPCGTIIERTALFYESFGNFATVCLSINGKKSTYFIETKTLSDGSEFIGVILK